MERNGIPDQRLRRYAMAAADEGRVADQQRVAKQALQNVRCLLETGEVERAAAPTGSVGVAADRDLAAKTGAAVALDDLGAPVAAALVRGAVAYERSALAGRVASRNPEDQP